MELRHLRSFMVLAELLHFTRAAEKLHIVQPALSQQSKELEEELGVTLFRRDKRKVELTEAGRIFLQEARKVLDQTKQAAILARQAELGDIGRIRIGYSAGSAMSGILGKILRLYRKDSPLVELDLHQVYPETQLGLLMQRELDIIFGMTVALKVPAACTMIPLATYPLHVVMPEDHPLAAKTKVSPAMLRDQPFIAYSGPEDVHGNVFLETALGFVPEIVRSTINLLFVSVLVEAGFGLAIMPTAMLQPFANSLVSRPICGISTVFNVVAVVRREAMAPAVERLVAIAVRAMGPEEKKPGLKKGRAQKSARNDTV